MSVKIEFKIDCTVCLASSELFSSTKKEAIAEAKRIGWKVGRDHNFCPKCLGVKN